MPKQRTIMTPEEKIEAEAVRFNERQDSGTVEPDSALVALVVEAIRLAPSLRSAKQREHGCNVRLMIQAGLSGESFAAVKQYFTADKTWPKPDGKPVGEGKAKGTDSGDALNSLRAVWGRYAMVDGEKLGVPIVEVDPKTKQNALVTVGAKRYTTAYPQESPEQAALQAQQSILDNITAEQFDRLRPALETLNFRLDLLTVPFTKAA